MLNYYYKGTSLDKIFCVDDPDNTDKRGFNNYISNSNSNDILLFEITNKIVPRQNIIPYLVDGTSITVYAGSRVMAFFSNHTNTTEQNISISSGCVGFRALLCGAGGSGGAGGGDTTGKKGTDGAGGSGGAYYYNEILFSSLQNYNSANSTFSIKIGTGGDPVSGGIPGTNNGNIGNNGTSTVVYHIYGTNKTDIARANGGVGGDGGHPSSAATISTGATGGNGTLILGGSDSVGLNGGQSGWSLFKANPTGSSYPAFPNTSGSYGNGGKGTGGGYDPNGSLTGAGSNGWGRIYYLF